MTTPQFFVSQDLLEGQDVVLRGEELYHLRVRRLRVGSEVILSDGLGHQRKGILMALDRHQARIKVNADQPPQTESPLHLVLAQAMLKPDRLDFVIEKATELGVTELAIFRAARSGRRIPADRTERWVRIARSAAKQSGRSCVPAISVVAFEDLVARPIEARLLFWENGQVGGMTTARRRWPNADSVLAVVGPEGGFTDAEAKLATRYGTEIIGFGPRIMRAETAAIAVATLCQFLWGDLDISQ